MGRVDHPVSVLLVEDEVLISTLVADTLSENGFEVHEATTADEALRYIEAGGAVDVLFTDVNLPGSMDGRELAARVRAWRPELPVVYASGRYDSRDIGRLVPRSVFMTKPYNPDDVCKLLTRLTETAH
jgi:CheY-like chemotaxis protein